MYGTGFSPNAKRGEHKINTGAKQRETKSERAASPLPSRGPEEGGNATSPCILRDPGEVATSHFVSPLLIFGPYAWCWGSRRMQG